MSRSFIMMCFVVLAALLTPSFSTCQDTVRVLCQKNATNMTSNEESCRILQEEFKCSNDELDSLSQCTAAAIVQAQVGFGEAQQVLNETCGDLNLGQMTCNGNSVAQCDMLLVQDGSLVEICTGANAVINCYSNMLNNNPNCNANQKVIVETTIQMVKNRIKQKGCGVSGLMSSTVLLLGLSVVSYLLTNFK